MFMVCMAATEQKIFCVEHKINQNFTDKSGFSEEFNLFWCKAHYNSISGWNESEYQSKEESTCYAMADWTENGSKVCHLYIFAVIGSNNLCLKIKTAQIGSFSGIWSLAMATSVISMQRKWAYPRPFVSDKLRVRGNLSKSQRKAKIGVTNQYFRVLLSTQNCDTVC